MTQFARKQTMTCVYLFVVFPIHVRCKSYSSAVNLAIAIISGFLSLLVEHLAPRTDKEGEVERQSSSVDAKTMAGIMTFSSNI